MCHWINDPLESSVALRIHQRKDQYISLINVIFTIFFRHVICISKPRLMSLSMVKKCSKVLQRQLRHHQHMINKRTTAPPAILVDNAGTLRNLYPSWHLTPWVAMIDCYEFLLPCYHPEFMLFIIPRCMIPRRYSVSTISWWRVHKNVRIILK